MQTDPLLTRAKAALEKAQNRLVPDDEANQTLTFLRKLAMVTVENHLEDKRRLKRLQQSPEGFVFDLPGYACPICDGPADAKESWFDLYGLNCMTCQEAIRRGEAPAWLGQKRGAWYSTVELEIYFGLKRSSRTRWIKEGWLKPRTLTRPDGKVHLQAYLREDHPGMFPPKELLEGCFVTECIEGQQRQTLRPWNECHDPNLVLKGFKILDYWEYR